MIVQTMVVPNEVCDMESIYFRVIGHVERSFENIILYKKSSIKTNTYMNIFDAVTWEKYTGITKWINCFKLSGKGTIIFFCRKKSKEIILKEISFDCRTVKEINMLFDTTVDNGMFYYEIRAESMVVLEYVSYGVCKMEIQEKREINLGVIFCTYKRNSQIKKNLECLKKSRFFNNNDDLYYHMNIHVIDNASELPILNEKHISIYHNANTGGSGGFTRGIEEIRKSNKQYQTTNVIFMDDDIEVIPETFYRLYALLTLMKERYQNEVIAGRMFRMDQTWIQYTAAEVWNDGNIRHIGFNLDMTILSNLEKMNDNFDAQYSGWWFACFPIEFVMKETPLPFFIHCDDVEYGLRHGGNPIILNGIQVWHETYEYRQTPILSYYDMRNSLIVNSIYGEYMDKKEILSAWKSKLCTTKEEKNYLTELMLILAMYDYLKGAKRFINLNVNKKHYMLVKKKYAKINSIFIKLIEIKILMSSLKKIIIKYKNIVK